MPPAGSSLYLAIISNKRPDAQADIHRVNKLANDNPSILEPVELATDGA